MHFIEIDALKNEGPDRAALHDAIQGALSDLSEAEATRLRVAIYYARVHASGQMDQPRPMRDLTFPVEGAVDVQQVADRMVQHFSRGVGEGFRGRIMIQFFDGDASPGEPPLPGGFDRYIQIGSPQSTWGGVPAVGGPGMGGPGMGGFPVPHGGGGGGFGPPDMMAPTIDDPMPDMGPVDYDPQLAASVEAREFNTSMLNANERRLDGEREHSRALVNALITSNNNSMRMAQHAMELATRALDRAMQPQDNVASTGNPMIDAALNVADRFLNKPPESLPSPPEMAEAEAPGAQEAAWQPPPPVAEFHAGDFDVDDERIGVDHQLPG